MSKDEETIEADTPAAIPALQVDNQTLNNTPDPDADKHKLQARNLKMIIDGVAIILRLAASKAVFRIEDIEKRKKTVTLVNGFDSFLVELSASLSSGIKDPAKLVNEEIDDEAGLKGWKLDLEDEHTGEFFKILSDVKEQLVPLVLMIAGSYISQKDIRIIALNNAISRLANKV